MRSRSINKMATLAAGLGCFAAVALGGAPAHAQPNQHAENWAALQKVLGFAGAAYGYVNGAIGAIQWLTGGGGAPKEDALAQMGAVVAEALRAERKEVLASRTESLVNRLQMVQNLVAANMAQMGNDPMSSSWAKTYLASRMANLQDDAADLYTEIARILRRTAVSGRDGYALEKEAVAMVPAFMMVVPVQVAAMKMVGELDPSLAAGNAQNLRLVLADAGRTYYRLVGTYAIGWAVCNPGERCWPAASPVGLDQAQMWKRQLYSYYHRLANGNLNTYPAARWSGYQSIPLVNAALRSLESINATYRQQSGWSSFTFEEKRVWIMDYSDPNDPNRTRPTYTDVPNAWIRDIWACDRANPMWICPRIADQGN